MDKFLIICMPDSKNIKKLFPEQSYEDGNISFYAYKENHLKKILQWPKFDDLYSFPFYFDLQSKLVVLPSINYLNRIFRTHTQNIIYFPKKSAKILRDHLYLNLTYQSGNTEPKSIFFQKLLLHDEPFKLPNSKYTSLSHVNGCLYKAIHERPQEAIEIKTEVINIDKQNNFTTVWCNPLFLTFNLKENQLTKKLDKQIDSVERTVNNILENSKSDGLLLVEPILSDIYDPLIILLNVGLETIGESLSRIKSIFYGNRNSYNGIKWLPYMCLNVLDGVFWCFDDEKGIFYKQWFKKELTKNELWFSDYWLKEWGGESHNINISDYKPIELSDYDKNSHKNRKIYLRMISDTKIDTVQKVWNDACYYIDYLNNNKNLSRDTCLMKMLKSIIQKLYYVVLDDSSFEKLNNILDNNDLCNLNQIKNRIFVNETVLLNKIETIIGKHKLDNYKKIFLNYSNKRFHSYIHIAHQAYIDILPVDTKESENIDTTDNDESYDILTDQDCFFEHIGYLLLQLSSPILVSLPHKNRLPELLDSRYVDIYHKNTSNKYLNLIYSVKWGRRMFFHLMFGNLNFFDDSKFEINFENGWWSKWYFGLFRNNVSSSFKFTERSTRFILDQSCPGEILGEVKEDILNYKQPITIKI